MAYDIQLEQHSGCPLAVVRRRAKQAELAKVIPDACGAVWKVMKALQVTDAGRHVAVYWDCQSDLINLEVGIELTKPSAGHGEVVGSSTPAGPVATTTHFGPYGQLHQVHTAIQQWCASHGHKLAGPSWEVYGHWQDEWNRDPSQIRTDIFYLVAADGSD